MTNNILQATALEFPEFMESYDASYQQRIELTLHFYQQSIIRILYDNQGQPIAEAEISADDVARILVSQLPGTQTGFLPRNIVQATPIGDNWHVVQYLPPQVRTLAYSGPEFTSAFTIPLPPMVVIGKPPKQYKFFALADDTWPGPDTPLYYAPVPNIYASHKVCIGDVKFPQPAPDTIEQAVKLFFESRFNADLADGKSISQPHNVVKVWQKLEAKQAEDYPLKDLVSAEMTLGEATV